MYYSIGLGSRGDPGPSPIMRRKELPRPSPEPSPVLRRKNQSSSNLMSRSSSVWVLLTYTVNPLLFRGFWFHDSCTSGVLAGFYVWERPVYVPMLSIFMRRSCKNKKLANKDSFQYIETRGQSGHISVTYDPSTNWWIPLPKKKTNNKQEYIKA